MSEKILVFIPTYNERRNAEKMCRALRALPFAPDVLFVDDNSPDGTGAILDHLAAKDPAVHVVHRPGKQGIGTAHLFGIRWAYAQGYSKLMTLDCDFTHRPEYLPQFLEASRECDFVISTRYGASPENLKDWTPYRRFLTRFGHILTTAMLGMTLDATTSFRLYRLDRIPVEVFDDVQAAGYAFFFESAYILHLAGFSIREVPVVLPARQDGESKMNFAEVLASLRRFLRLFALRVMGPYRGYHQRRTAPRTQAKPTAAGR
ncbi:MAG: polyprenol monophosphomannose synthase [Bryobacterales bacterium]|nr:polyprenol monophosphomannose synthase [Bryobacterales bacterium]